MKYIGLFDEKEDIVTKEKLEAVEAAIPTKTSQLDNDSGFITSAPVTSVNTKIGAVTLSASDVGAQPTITVNGIIKGDGAGNLSEQEIVAAELVDLPTVPTKVSELTNDSGYITAVQAPVQSVNNKTGTVSLTASDVDAIPSTLTGTVGQVLTKTVDGQEWKDAAKELPAVTTADNGKFLSVVSGAWAAAEAASITPHIDETTKHWMIGNTDTGIVAEGKTSYIGDNGNWYEWDATSGTFVDSGVSAHPFPYVQPDEPIDAPEFSIWVDTDEEALYIARAEGVGF